jgi:hypothetical protein
MKEIIILDQENPKRNKFRVVYWVPIPAERQARFANPDFISAYENATADELNALKSGAYVEVLEYPSFSSSATKADIVQDLSKTYTKLVADYAGKNHWKWYGTFREGGAWTNAGVS